MPVETQKQVEELPQIGSELARYCPFSAITFAYRVQTPSIGVLKRGGWKDYWGQEGQPCEGAFIGAVTVR
jgi:hypothetical protein